MTSAHTRREVRRDTATGRPRRSTGAPASCWASAWAASSTGSCFTSSCSGTTCLTSTDSDNVGIQYYPRETVHGLQLNTMWDGLFHAFTWVMVLAGLAMLYSRVQHSRGRVWSSRVLWGWVLVGWGLFNILEGVVDQRPGDPPRAQRATPTRLGS